MTTYIGNILSFKFQFDYKCLPCTSEKQRCLLWPAKLDIMETIG